jgi:hypothetical protein
MEIGRFGCHGVWNPHQYYLCLLANGTHAYCFSTFFHTVLRLLLMNPCIFQGHSWRHANFASKGLKMMLGTCGSPSFFWLNELGAMFASSSFQLCQLVAGYWHHYYFLWYSYHSSFQVCWDHVQSTGWIKSRTLIWLPWGGHLNSKIESCTRFILPFFFGYKRMFSYWLQCR